MKQKQVSTTVPKELFDRQARELEQLHQELDLYQQKSPIVGVRWFGRGGFGIGLSHPVGGVTKLILDGYGDKAVIDYTTWLRIKNTEHAKLGLLVRDDSVIDELNIIGVTAKSDVNKPGPNSFTPEEAKKILEGTIKELKKVIDDLTSFWGAIHLLDEARDLGITDESRLSVIRNRKNYLLLKFRVSLLHPHDLQVVCESFKVKDSENLSIDEKIEAITKIEYDNLNSSDLE
jgi:hypothetical protein